MNDCGYRISRDGWVGTRKARRLRAGIRRRIQSQRRGSSGYTAAPNDHQNEPSSKVHRRTYSNAVKKSPERDAAKAQEYFEHPRTSLAADVQRRAHREEYHGELRLGSWRRLREEQTHHYVRWSFFAVIAAVIVGLIGVGLTFLH